MGYGYGDFGGQNYSCYGGYRSGFELVVVLFILLIIIGATVYNR